MTAELKQTCSACPSQWEGRSVSGYPFYVRYRWGKLRVHIGYINEQVDAVGLIQHGHVLFEEQLGDEYDGEISWDDVVKHAGNLLAL